MELDMWLFAKHMGLPFGIVEAVILWLLYNDAVKTEKELKEMRYAEWKKS